MKMPVAVLVATTVLSVAAARADVTDLAALTCQQMFTTVSDDNMGLALAWMRGHYAKPSDAPVIDTDKLMDDGQKLSTYCMANPTVNILKAAATVFAQK